MAETAEISVQSSQPPGAPDNKKTGRTGRPPLVIDWQVFEALCTCHATLEEIAAYFKCDTRTIERQCKRVLKTTFAAYYREKAATGKVSIRRKQFQVALKGDPQMLKWLGMNWLGQKNNTGLEVGGPNGGPIPHEIDIKDQDTLEREIGAFFRGLKFGEHRERTRGASPRILESGPAGLHPAPDAETLEAKS